MCGIAGFIDLKLRGRRDEAISVARRMADKLRHRGPDDAGGWGDADCGVGFGFRRLSILDLTEAGHQPMVSHDGRFVIIFNGEIYNHHAIRGRLESARKIAWRGHSDTETMLEAIATWGIEEALRSFNGMFAFALWDCRERVLSLARDRFGEKPLYYGRAVGVFLFASELKAMAAHPEFRGEIDRDAVALFLRHSCIPAPHSIYKGIYKLPPATLLTLRGGGAEPELSVYWSLPEVVERGQKSLFKGSVEEAVEALDGVLRNAVKLRMESDVPLGAFLSGGIDSSTIVALMQAQSGQPVKTFSIGFHEDHYNEAEHAKRVASHLGTEHEELYVSSEAAMAVIPQLHSLYDEPFADSSQIPTHLLASLARRRVTVALSGDGGDELFGGYPRYRACDGLWRKTGWIPSAIRRGMAGCIRVTPSWAMEWGGRCVMPLLRRYGATGRFSDKLLRVADVLSAENPGAMYRQLISHWDDSPGIVLGAGDPGTIHTRQDRWPALPMDIHRMMFLDTSFYLPDDILVKVDRASMGVSLETRVPLLDHHAVEFAWTLPLSLKVTALESKWILKQVLDRYVPSEMTARPKMGFGVPIGAWLVGPLKDWAEALLDEGRIRREGFLDARPIRKAWREHLDGRRNWQYHLWDVLMFQAWLEAEG